MSPPEAFNTLLGEAQKVGGDRAKLQEQLDNIPNTYGHLFDYMMKGVKQAPGGPVETQKIFGNFVNEAKREMAGAKQELGELDGKLDDIAKKATKIVRDAALETLDPRETNSAVPQKRPTHIARMPAGPEKAGSATRPAKRPKKKAAPAAPAAGAAPAAPAGAKNAGGAVAAAVAQAKEN
jgi:hypothetical protein